MKTSKFKSQLKESVHLVGFYRPRIRIRLIMLNLDPDTGQNTGSSGSVTLPLPVYLSYYMSVSAGQGLYIMEAAQRNLRLFS